MDACQHQYHPEGQSQHEPQPVRLGPGTSAGDQSRRAEGQLVQAIRRRARGGGRRTKWNAWSRWSRDRDGHHSTPPSSQFNRKLTAMAVAMNVAVAVKLATDSA